MVETTRAATNRKMPGEFDGQTSHRPEHYAQRLSYFVPVQPLEWRTQQTSTGKQPAACVLKKALGTFRLRNRFVPCILS